jgi:hypothetical protein
MNDQSIGGAPHRIRRAPNLHNRLHLPAKSDLGHIPR